MVCLWNEFKLNFEDCASRFNLKLWTSDIYFTSGNLTDFSSALLEAASVLCNNSLDKKPKQKNSFFYYKIVGELWKETVSFLSSPLKYLHTSRVCILQSNEQGNVLASNDVTRWGRIFKTRLWNARIWKKLIDWCENA